MAETEITREHLHAYLDEALSDAEMADVEKALRADAGLQKRLRVAMQERDRGEHSLGAIWRRERLTCLSREQLGNSLLEVLEPEEQAYVRFHLQEVKCPYCLANFVDLSNLQLEPSPHEAKRRRRYFNSSAGYLSQARDGDAPSGN